MTIGNDFAARAKAIILVIAAVACLAAVDGFCKIIAETQSFGQIMLARYAPALFALLVISGPRNWREVFTTHRPGIQIMSALSPVLVGGLMVLAVRYLPLAEATVVLFAGPFIVVALSGKILGERVNTRSWIAVAIGFVAVIIVARPGIDGLSGYTIFPAVAAVFYALMQIFIRKLAVSGQQARTTVAWTLLVGTAFSLPLAVFDWRSPNLSQWVILSAIGVCFGLGQHFMTRAFSLAPANVLTPFSYFQIIAATIFGLVVFQSVPDGWTILGMAMIVCAGVFAVGQKKAPSLQIEPAVRGADGWIKRR